MHAATAGQHDASLFVTSTSRQSLRRAGHVPPPLGALCDDNMAWLASFLWSHCSSSDTSGTSDTAITTAGASSASNCSGTSGVRGARGAIFRVMVSSFDTASICSGAKGAVVGHVIIISVKADYGTSERTPSSKSAVKHLIE